MYTVAKYLCSSASMMHVSRTELMTTIVDLSSSLDIFISLLVANRYCSVLQSAVYLLFGEKVGLQDSVTLLIIEFLTM